MSGNSESRQSPRPKYTRRALIEAARSDKRVSVLRRPSGATRLLSRAGIWVDIEEGSKLRLHKSVEDWRYTSPRQAAAWLGIEVKTGGAKR